MDPFTALGVAAAVIQITDFGTRFARNMITMYKMNRPEDDLYFEQTTMELNQAIVMIDERAKRPALSSNILDQNEQAIKDLSNECKTLTGQLQKICESIRAPAKALRKSLASRSSRGSSVFEKALQTFKATWKEKDVEQMISKLEGLRTQLILRMLLTLDIKTDEVLSKQDAHMSVLKQNTSNVVEVLAIYQEQSEARGSREANRVEKRMDQSDEMSRRFHEEVVAAILTLRDGETKVIKPQNDEDAAENDHWRRRVPSTQTMLRLRSDGADSSPEVTFKNFMPAQVQDIILRSLTFRQISDRVDMISVPYKTTYSWMFCDPEARDKPWSNFPRWLSEEYKGCYWVSGKAGSGKSTLMKYLAKDIRLVQGLSTWAGDDDLIMASYFFLGLGSNLQKSQEGLLRSLLFEVFSRRPELIQTVMHELVFIAADFKEDERLSPPSLSELLKWMRRLLSDYNSIRYCFLIDGVDEYDGDPATVVDLVASLAEFRSVKFLLSSRPIPVCVENLSCFPMLKLQDLTRNDIREYATGELATRFQKRGFDALDYSGLVDHIVEKSCGVFIWVVLSVRSLIRGLENRDRITELRERLLELPSDLADLYAHMMTNMTPLYRTQGCNLFRLAMATLDTSIQHMDCPLLTLQASFADEDPSTGLGQPLEQINEDEELRRCDEIEGRIRSRCCGLIETRRALPSEKELLSFSRYEYPCVDFMHRTVVEFLSDEEVWKGIVEQSNSRFIPPVVLFHSCVRTCQVLPPTKTITNSESPMWQMMRRGLTYASRAEDLGTPVPRPQLQDLDRLVSAHWKIAASFHAGDNNLYETSGHWGKKLRFIGVAEGTHEKESERVLSEALGAVDFASIAIAHCLPSYFKEQIYHDAAPERSAHLNTILLYRASQMFLGRAWFGAKAPTRYSMAIDICERLLEHKADPNRSIRASNVGHSVWQDVLIFAARPGAAKALEEYLFNREFDEVGTTFIMNFSRLVIVLIKQGADVNCLAPSAVKGVPRRPLTILQNYYSSLGSMGDLKAEENSGQISSAVPLATVSSEVLDLIITKGGQPDEVTPPDEGQKVVAGKVQTSDELSRRLVNKMRRLLARK